MPPAPRSIAYSRLYGRTSFQVVWMALAGCERSRSRSTTESRRLKTRVARRRNAVPGGGGHAPGTVKRSDWKRPVPFTVTPKAVGRAPNGTTAS